MGTVLTVSDNVMAMEYLHQTPDQRVVSNGFTLEQVHPILAYNYLHKDEIDTDIRNQRKEVREFRDKHVNCQTSATIGD